MRWNFERTAQCTVSLYEYEISNNLAHSFCCLVYISNVDFRISNLQDSLFSHRFPGIFQSSILQSSSIYRYIFFLFQERSYNVGFSLTVSPLYTAILYKLFCLNFIHDALLYFHLWSIFFFHFYLFAIYTIYYLFSKSAALLLIVPPVIFIGQILYFLQLNYKYLFFSILF